MTQAYNLSQLANNLNTSGQLDATDGLVNAVPVSNGGTGASTQSVARSNLDVPSTSGSGASGTWNIDINGSATSAGTVTSTINSGVTATTQPNGDNSTKVATTAFVQNAIGIPVNVQTFNSTGVWTKPGNGQTMARIQVWGGGGGGGRYYSGVPPTSGAGGGYMEITVPLSYLAATVTAVVGSGGAGATTSAQYGGAGGSSSFPLSTSVNGLTSITATGGNSFVVYDASTGIYDVAGGAPLASDGSRAGPLEWIGGNGYPFNSPSYASNSYANAGVYGGSSGTVFAYYPSTATGAVSLFGGQGGGVTITSTGGYGTAGNGVVPGGGGTAGGSSWPAGAYNGGNGASGRIVVTCW